MRGWWLISVLALAGCGEHLGWNPNYQFGASTYGQYLAARETALVSGLEGPPVIPVARPVLSPTAEQIAGRNPVPIPATMGVPTRSVVTAAVVAETAEVPVKVVPGTMVVGAGGPYPGSTPVLVQYAQGTDNRPGSARYARPQASATVAARVCASYATSDAAQIAFLAAGGPQRDPRGMDPDGDGFVCGWDPAPYRRALP